MTMRLDATAFIKKISESFFCEPEHVKSRLNVSPLWVADGVTCRPNFERSKLITHMVRSIL